MDDIKIVDNSLETIYNYNKSIDRKIYLRLQQVYLYPLGSLPSDLKNPIKDFMDTFNSIGTGVVSTNLADNFLGTLGMTRYYPTRDNMYKGGLLNA